MTRWIDVTPSLVFDTSWTLWGLSWIAAAVWSAVDVEWRPMRRDWLPYGLIVASILVPVAWTASGWPAARWWDVGRDGAYGLAAATIAGFVFAWWARLHLGALWSAAITCKRDHRVIDTGPYALVRHPIYAGILWAALNDGPRSGDGAGLHQLCRPGGRVPAEGGSGRAFFARPTRRRIIRDIQPARSDARPFHAPGIAGWIVSALRRHRLSACHSGLACGAPE